MRTPRRLSLVLLGALGVFSVLGAMGCPQPYDEPEPPKQWTTVAQHAREALLSVGGRSEKDVFAVGADKGHGPIVLHYTVTDDGAKTWERLTTGSRGDLWWVHAFPEGPVFVAGAYATVLKYEDGAFTRMKTPGIGFQTVYGVWGPAPDDLYAVGSGSGRNGFVWHFDGTQWTDLALPAELPTTDLGDTPGFFKVWGHDADDVWVVGGRGTVLRGNARDGFKVVPSGTEEPLFTVHGDSDDVVIVGGSAQGILLEDVGASLETELKEVPFVQGVCMSEDHGFASGRSGALFQRSRAGWTAVETDLELDLESLHAVWIDPKGDVWAVGGDVISAALGNGGLVHGGAEIPAIDPTLIPTADDPPPAPTCPEDQIDPAPDKSIARRWNEQILGAIRRDIPRPGVHARNLYHVSAAIWDAWAAYDDTADGVFFTEKLAAADEAAKAAARDEAISRAAYGVLKHRYEAQIGGPVSVLCFDGFMAKLGYDPGDTTVSGDSPAAVGNRIAAAVIAAGAGDGANEANNYADTTMYMSPNEPLVVDLPGARLVDPSQWQPLNLAEAATQNGIVLPAGVQKYIGANWGLVAPFAMTKPQDQPLYHDPGAPPLFTDPEMKGWLVEVLQKHTKLDPSLPETIDISPGAYGNNPLGTNDGAGRPMNPITGQPYAPNVVKLGDFSRVLAEFWADGPKSETPPGHWNVLANSVADSPGFPRQWAGQGAALDPLEWDVRVYLAVNGAVHDAAITAWGIKREFAAIRPISLVRYMGGLGQSSDPSGPAYHKDGLPLVPGVIEVITAESSAPGQRHAHLARYVGQIAVHSWRGEPGDRAAETAGVAWMRAIDWLPYQRRNFVTPAFPGFISGHSTFSRAAAEVLAKATGSEYFPGGLGEFVAPAGTYLVFEDGPSTEVRLQWATYYDAADQAGQSRLWGGIHIWPDDKVGRTLGSQVGLDAFARATSHIDGSAIP